MRSHLWSFGDVHRLLGTTDSNSTLCDPLWVVRLWSAHLSLRELRGLDVHRKDDSNTTSDYDASTSTIFLQELSLHFLCQHQCHFWYCDGCSDGSLRPKSLASKKPGRNLCQRRISATSTKCSSTSGRRQWLSRGPFDRQIRCLTARAKRTHPLEMLWFTEEVLGSPHCCYWWELDLIDINEETLCALCLVFSLWIELALSKINKVKQTCFDH